MDQKRGDGQLRLTKNMNADQKTLDKISSSFGDFDEKPHKWDPRKSDTEGQ